ncbi:MAG: hypothetical protein LKI80_07395 [Sporolactobacillus sp.]|nr:hypothetical protein [Sporolactobacillus sp.]
MLAKMDGRSKGAHLFAGTYFDQRNEVNKIERIITYSDKVKRVTTG